MSVIKRNSDIVDYLPAKVENAILKAMYETTVGANEILALEISEAVGKFGTHENISVESIQNMIEHLLMVGGRQDVAIKFAKYREYRNKTRDHRDKYTLLDDAFISKYKHQPSPMKQLGNFVYYRTYSRWLEEESRREYWWETVRRAVEYNCKLDPSCTKEEAEKIFDNVYNLKQFSSGRLLWVGGTPIVEQNPMAAFNCSFITMDDLDNLKDLFMLLLLGSGVGFRALPSDAEKLATVSKIEIEHKEYTPLPKGWRLENTITGGIVGRLLEVSVGDSKQGWIDALGVYIDAVTGKLQTSKIIFNYDSVRPNGEKLKVFGGRASGPKSLKTLLTKIHDVVCSAVGGQLKPIDIIDMCNIIGECVVSGGVRRTSELAMIDKNDIESIDAKSSLYTQVQGQWVENKKISHRKVSNNTVMYFDKPTREEMHHMVEKLRYSAEPGFCNVQEALRREPLFMGGNPCFEILLQSKLQCNLTTLNLMGFVKNEVFQIQEALEAQRYSVRMAIRMTLLKLEMPEWDKVAKEHRVVGVSLTGFQDMVNATGMGKLVQVATLQRLRAEARAESKAYCETLGISEPNLVTAGKPEGSLSLLPTVSAGVHFSHSPFYIRRVRISASDPVLKVCEELGYPVKVENGQVAESCTTKVVEFPVKAPQGRTKYDVSAIEQLEIYKMFMQNYVDHNQSITVSVREHEWVGVEQWLWDNWYCVVGVTFISLDDSFYPLLPYEAISEDEYNKRVNEMKPFIPSLISKYEQEEVEIDVGTSECTGSVCPIR